MKTLQDIQSEINDNLRVAAGASKPEKKRLLTIITELRNAQNIIKSHDADVIQKMNNAHLTRIEVLKNRAKDLRKGPQLAMINTELAQLRVSVRVLSYIMVDNKEATITLAHS